MFVLILFFYLRIEECNANGNENIIISVDGGKCLECKQQCMNLFNLVPHKSSNCIIFQSQDIPRTFLCYTV